MSKKGLFLAVLFSLMLALPIHQAEAFGAKITSRTKGLGYDIDLNSITFRLGQIDALRFDVSLGLGLNIQTKGKTQTSFDMTPGFRVLIPLVQNTSWLVQIVAGIHTLFNFAKETNIGFSLFGGFMPELFILPNLSIEMMFGFSLAFNDLTNDVEINIGTVGKGISFLSGAAFHWYF